VGKNSLETIAFEEIPHVMKRASFRAIGDRALPDDYATTTRQPKQFTDVKSSSYTIITVCAEHVEKQGLHCKRH